MEELNEEYGDLLKGRQLGLAAALRKIHVKTDKRNLLKDQLYVALAYMTGILPVKKYGQHSALNMFREYSMTNQRNFEEYTGFTEEVKALCGHFGMNFSETGSWYDGYRFKRLLYKCLAADMSRSIREAFRMIC